MECVGADEADISRAFDLLERHGLGRKRIADALFAATLLNNGVSELVTCDAGGGYRQFDGLTMVDPRR